jgi:predicted HicB family RNase H-like nuclease
VIGDSPAHRQSAVSRPVAGVPTVAGRGQRVMVSSCGLVLPNRLPFERWLGIGRHLSAVSSSSAWCLGDWLAFGQTAYAGRYRLAIEQTSLDYQTLRNYAWVARRFAMSRRRDTLSFGHHAEVASLAEPEQDFWLRKAEQHGWPVKRLRKEVGASLAERSADQHDQPVPSPRNEDWVTLRLQLRISQGQLETCQAAAGKASLSLEAWTILALEHAARHELADAGGQQPRPADPTAANTVNLTDPTPIRTCLTGSPVARMKSVPASGGAS